MKTFIRRLSGCGIDERISNICVAHIKIVMKDAPEGSARHIQQKKGWLIRERIAMIDVILCAPSRETGRDAKLSLEELPVPGPCGYER